MVRSFNEAILNDETPEQRLRAPLNGISEREVKTPKGRKLNDHDKPKTIWDEIVMLYEYDDNVYKKTGLSIPHMLNLPWDRWIGISDMLNRIREKKIEDTKAQTRKAAKETQTLESTLTNQKGKSR